MKKNSAILNSGAEPETLRRGVRIKTLVRLWRLPLGEDSLAAGAISRGFRPAQELKTTKLEIWWGCKNADYSDDRRLACRRRYPLFRTENIAEF